MNIKVRLESETLSCLIILCKRVSNVKLRVRTGYILLAGASQEQCLLEGAKEACTRRSTSGTNQNQPAFPLITPYIHTRASLCIPALDNNYLDRLYCNAT